jgi:hypothetical protein
MSIETYELKTEYRKAEERVLKQAQKLADKITKATFVFMSGVAVLFIIRSIV